MRISDWSSDVCSSDLLILIWLGGPVLGVVFGKLGSPFYPAYLLVQPLLVLVAVILLGSLLSRAAPGLAKLLSRGRLMAACRHSTGRRHGDLQAALARLEIMDLAAVDDLIHLCPADEGGPGG